MMLQSIDLILAEGFAEGTPYAWSALEPLLEDLGRADDIPAALSAASAAHPKNDFLLEKLFGVYIK